MSLSRPQTQPSTLGRVFHLSHAVVTPQKWVGESEAGRDEIPEGKLPREQKSATLAAQE
jgi:hypothetical protein